MGRVGGEAVRGENAAKDSSRRKSMTGTSHGHDSVNGQDMIGRKAASTLFPTNERPVNSRPELTSRLTCRHQSLRRLSRPRDGTDGRGIPTMC